MNKSILSVKQMAHCAVIAAIYVALCMALQPFSYGPIQVRVAEALCLLPVFGAQYIVGVTLGCLLANLLGSTIIDVIFGTLATLLACLFTYKLRNLRVCGLALPASLPPVLFNAVIVGAFMIPVFFSDTPATPAICLFNAATVGFGEVISCCILGVLLVKVIENSPALCKLMVAEA